jgi:transcriptional regulator with XRE-family HTH domain
MDTPFKRLREEAGLTQGEISAELGMATQYFQQIESGKRNPRTDTTVRIARVLAEKLGRTPGDVLAELAQVDSKENAAAVTAA